MIILVMTVAINTPLQGYPIGLRISFISKAFISKAFMCQSAIIVCARRELVKVVNTHTLISAGAS